MSNFSPNGQSNTTKFIWLGKFRGSYHGPYITYKLFQIENNKKDYNSEKQFFTECIFLPWNYNHFPSVNVFSEGPSIWQFL